MNTNTSQLNGRYKAKSKTQLTLQKTFPPKYTFGFTFLQKYLQQTTYTQEVQTTTRLMAGKLQSNVVGRESNLQHFPKNSSFVN